MIRAQVLCGLILLPSLAFAQDAGQMPPMGPPEELKSLDFLLGEWNVAVKVRMGPDAPWQESTGTASHRKEIGGAAFINDFDGTMMGQKFVGRETLTYNRETSQFESFWIDSIGAKASTMTGGWEGETFIMSGTDTMMGQTYHMRNSVSKNDDGSLTFSMDMSMDGENWFESMTMVYTKKS